MTLRPIDRVLDKLNYQGPRDRNDYQCLCPSHDDRNPSLSVTEKPDGTVLVHCFAGCQPKDIVAALGMTMKDLSVTPTRTRAKIVATYDYLDHEGYLLYQVVRYEPKTFRQRKPKPGGGWEWSLKGVTPVLYRLPDLLDSDPDQWVFLVEGEKDADNVCKLGLVATTNAQGAEKWQPHFNEWLRDRRICILPDNDDSGRKHAHKVAPGLTEVATQVRVLELPDLPAKGDVSDWIANGGTADQLLALVEDATDYDPDHHSGSEPGLDPNNQELIRVAVGQQNWDMLIAICSQLPRKFAAPFVQEQLFNALGDESKVKKHLAKIAFASDPVSIRIRSDMERWGYALTEDETDSTIYLNSEPLDDATEAQIKLQARDDGYGVKGHGPSLAALEEAIKVIARENLFHPIRDWLDTLVWDKTPRLEEFSGYFKDAHRPITLANGATVSVFQSFFQRWMLGAVAKAYTRQGKPSPQTPMLVLEGPQGLGKSYLAQWLCSPLPNMFIEKAINPDNDEHVRFLATKWIWEVGELGSTVRRADRESLKHFLTQGNVTFRTPYAKRAVTKPVLANFIGTLNNEVGFLTDPTGNRRFMTVELKSIDRSYSHKFDVTQLWAEVVHYYRLGASHLLTPAEEAMQRELNESAYVISDTHQALLKYFEINPEYDGSKPEHDDWWMYLIDIVEHLNAQSNGLKTNARAVGAELRKELGRPSEVQRRNEDGGSRVGRGFYGIRKVPLKNFYGPQIKIAEDLESAS